MLRDHRDLIAEIADLAEAPAPEFTQEDAPVLSGEALDDGAGMYIVGLIGGKDVGKSALVNALVGQTITAQTSHGPGTETVIAYAHESQVQSLRELLDREAPGQYRIVTHAIDALRRQVLLDLPDIDSHYESHVRITRRMLRHMLFPVWVQSVEKYADRRPRELLDQVSAGNACDNFVFCLNKADQVAARDGEPAARELCADSAQRLARQLSLPAPPRVWLISALQPDRFDLPELRRLLMRQRDEPAVRGSVRLARATQRQTLARWIEKQDLGQRLAALDRLERSATEDLAARVGVPLIEKALPRLVEDPACRMALADEVMARRVERWPIVNILHVILAPLVFALRRRLPLGQQSALQGPRQLVDEHLRDLDGQGVSVRIQAAFAQLQRSSPLISRVYAHRRLWESPDAEAAEMDLRQRLADTLDRQRSEARARLGGGGAIWAPLRLLLTVGALLWFPIGQPLLEAWLEGTRQMVILAVRLFSAAYLLEAAGFLAVWYLVLWLYLKWSTQRKVDRWLARWKSADRLDPTLSLTAQVVDWTRGLAEPIRIARQRVQSVVERAKALVAA